MKQNTVIIYTAIGLELVNIILPQLCLFYFKITSELPIYICFELTTPSELIHRGLS